MKKQNYIEWKETIYLINFSIPWLKNDSCYECGHTKKYWSKKYIRFIPLREITHRRQKTIMDEIMEATVSNIVKQAQLWNEKFEKDVDLFNGKDYGQTLNIQRVSNLSRNEKVGKTSKG